MKTESLWELRNAWLAEINKTPQHEAVANELSELLVSVGDEVHSGVVYRLAELWEFRSDLHDSGSLRKFAFQLRSCMRSCINQNTSAQTEKTDKIHLYALIHGALSRSCGLLHEMSNNYGHRVTLEHTLRARALSNTCMEVIDQLEKDGEL